VQQGACEWDLLNAMAGAEAGRHTAVRACCLRASLLRAFLLQLSLCSQVLLLGSDGKDKAAAAFGEFAASIDGSVLCMRLALPADGKSAPLW
jgi:hypothetical protein